MNAETEIFCFRTADLGNCQSSCKILPRLRLGRKHDFTYLHTLPGVSYHPQIIIFGYNEISKEMCCKNYWGFVLRVVLLTSYANFPHKEKVMGYDAV